MIYASAGLNYGNIPALAAEYGIFDNPAAGFVTPRIDISAFAQLGNPLWPFDPTTVR